MKDASGVLGVLDAGALAEAEEDCEVEGVGSAVEGFLEDPVGADVVESNAVADEQDLLEEDQGFRNGH